MDNEQTPQAAKAPLDTVKDRVVLEGLPISAHLCFRYRNFGGEVTIRTVRATHVLVSEDDMLLAGHCELRGELRIFRSSRMSSIHVLSTASSAFSLKGALAMSNVTVPAPVMRAPRPQSPFIDRGTGQIGVRTRRGIVYVPLDLLRSATLQQGPLAAATLIRARLEAIHDEALEDVVRALSNPLLPDL